MNPAAYETATILKMLLTSIRTTTNISKKDNGLVILSINVADKMIVLLVKIK